jgi:hypothetical protein
MALRSSIESVRYLEEDELTSSWSFSSAFTFEVGADLPTHSGGMDSSIYCPSLSLCLPKQMTFGCSICHHFEGRRLFDSSWPDSERRCLLCKSYSFCQPASSSKYLVTSALLQSQTAISGTCWPRPKRSDPRVLQSAPSHSCDACSQAPLFAPH